jgi:hypothetical protein
MRVGVSACNTGANPNQTRDDLDMADIIIPPPGPDGYWHFTYVTTDSLDGRWYGGKRSTKKHPLSDRYLGSGNWVRKHPERSRLKREIVAFYQSSKEVFSAEAELVTWAVVLDDPLCMNQRDGGDGMTVEYARMRAADPNWQPIKLRAIAKRSANPKWRQSNADANRRRATDPELRNIQAAGCRKRSANPDWQEANRTTTRRLAGDPCWQDAHAAGLRRAMDSPNWQVICAARLAKRNMNETWRRNVGSAGTASLRGMREANPNWREDLIAGNKRMAKDPTWQAAVASGLAKRNTNPDWLASVATSNRSRTTIFVNLNGVRLSLKDACTAAGISYQTAFARRAKGLPESEWLSKPSCGPCHN